VRQIVLAACILAITTATAGRAAPAPAGFDAKELEQRIAREFEQHRMVGLAVAVSLDGKVVFEKGYGVRSLESREPVTADTRFGVGSVTKQFTCAAVLALADEGKLDFDDPVSKYYPDLTDAQHITLRDLGGHTSGYRDYYPLDFTDTRMRSVRPIEQIIVDYARKPLDFPPRSRYSYSNTGYLMLGRIAERVGGKPLSEQMRLRIFEPLGMANTALRITPAELPGSARGYTQVLMAGAEPIEAEAQDWLAGAGGLWSTAADLLRWDEAFLAGRAVSEHARAAMTTPLRLTDQRSSGYGCGLGVYDRPDMLRWSHTGAVAGFSALNAMVPNRRLAFAVLANTETSLDGVRQAIVDALATLPVEAPEVDGQPPLEAANDILGQLKAGKLDRSKVTPEFAALLTPERLAAGKKALKGAKIVGIYPSTERGGLEVTRLDVLVGKKKASATMFRRPDGIVEQFLLWPE